jgi:uroporphyrinogen decarboxylase
MTNRELFLALMHYQKVDRVPLIHWCGWPETRERWLKEGLPKDVPEHQFFGAAKLNHPIDVYIGLYPAFKEQTIEETDAYRIFRQSDGVIAQHWKKKSCIPHFIDFTLKADGAAWPEYKKRLQPDPARINYWTNLAERIAKTKDTDAVVSVNTGSMIGWLRDWMGVENLAYICYDNLDLLKEMCTTITDLVLWSLDQILPKIKVDLGWGWEDICFRTGPLISPDFFKEVAVPNYRRIADKLRAHGCDLYLVDCDGLVDALLPHWLDAGVNVMFPLEIGAWKADPADYRKRFGKNLRIFGGIDKLEIAKGRAAIDAEIARRLPLMKEGGFVAFPDHLLVPDTALADYQYYLEKMRQIRL